MPPSPNSDANPKPNPDPARSAIFRTPDYRPIFVLNILLKPYERVTVSQMLEFIKKENTYHQFKLDYHKNHFAKAFLITFMVNVITSMKSRDCVIIF